MFCFLFTLRTLALWHEIMENSKKLPNRIPEKKIPFCFIIRFYITKLFKVKLRNYEKQLLRFVLPDLPEAHNFYLCGKENHTALTNFFSISSAKSCFKDKNIPLLWMTFFLFFSMLFSSCGVYSFTGASVPAGAKTMSIQYFPNKAKIVEPILSTAFTNALRDRFTSQTNLQMVEKNGDIAIEGEIVSYTTTPEAILSNQTAALNRLSITVNVRFTSRLEPSKDFETRFTQYVDYSSTENFSTIKNTLIKKIVDDLTDNIFNKAMVNW